MQLESISLHLKTEKFGAKRISDSVPAVWLERVN